MSRRFSKAHYYLPVGNAAASHGQLHKRGLLAQFANVAHCTATVRAARGAARIACVHGNWNWFWFCLRLTHIRCHWRVPVPEP